MDEGVHLQQLGAQCGRQPGFLRDSRAKFLKCSSRSPTTNNSNSVHWRTSPSIGSFSIGRRPDSQTAQQKKLLKSRGRELGGTDNNHQLLLPINSPRKSWGNPDTSSLSWKGLSMEDPGMILVDCSNVQRCPLGYTECAYLEWIPESSKTEQFLTNFSVGPLKSKNTIHVS